MAAVTSLLRRGALGPPFALAVTLVVLAGLGSACTGERPSLADETTTTATPTTAAEEGPTTAEVAQAKETSIDVFATVDATTADRQIESGVDTSTDLVPIVFLVKERQDGDERIEVYLPGEPAGDTGWVDADDVSLSAVPYRIQVGISGHRLKLFRDDEVILDEPVGAGCDDRVVPGTVYFVKELVDTRNPGGAYGTYAYGLSGSVTIRESLADGSGVTGIHGTNDPDSVGTDVTTGCIRVVNDVIERMVEEIGLPLGTPVEILE